MPKRSEMQTPLRDKGGRRRAPKVGNSLAHRHDASADPCLDTAFDVHSKLRSESQGGGIAPVVSVAGTTIALTEWSGK